MAGRFPGGRPAGRLAPFEAEDEGFEDRPAVLASQQGLRGPLRVGHQPEDVAFGVPDAGDVAHGAVDVGLRGDRPVGLAVAEDDLPVPLDVTQRAGRGVSLIHISEPTRRTPISYAVFCLK